MLYRVKFVDEIHGESVEEFGTFKEASEYWQDYADAPTCEHGELAYGDEVIWSF